VSFVAQDSQCLVVGVAAFAVCVVEPSGARRCGQGSERLLVKHIGQPPVAGVAGQHDAALAGTF
jgi:hypothetical protein